MASRIAARSTTAGTPLNDVLVKIERYEESKWEFVIKTYVKS